MKKLLALFLSLLFVLSFVPFALAAETEETQTPSVSIASLDAFLSFAEACALESYSKDRVFSLDCDLDLSGATFPRSPTLPGPFSAAATAAAGSEGGGVATARASAFSGRSQRAAPYRICLYRAR